MPEQDLGDTRFYRRCGPFTVSQLAAAADGDCAASDVLIAGVAPLQSAGPSDVTFLEGERYSRLLDATTAGAVIVRADMVHRVPAGTTPIVATSVPLAWAEVVRMFHPSPPLCSGRHPTAYVADGAEIDDSAEIGPFAYVGAGVRVGARSRIGAHAVLNTGVTVGADCRIGAACTLSHTVIGAGSCLHPGVRTGQDGFGLAASASGLHTVPHLGRVIIGADVEIGANSAIDRGSLGDTVISAGCRIDNLVHIAHNVHIGRGCILVAQVGIAGSAVLEDFVQVGGQAAIAGHLRIGAVMQGCPAQPKAQFFRQVAWLRRKACGPRPTPTVAQ